MNFFDAQDRAKRATRWLVVVYILSTALIVAGVTMIVAAVLLQSGAAADPSLLGATAILATLFILGATLYKTAVLSSGGGRVAQDMGGTLVPTDVQDPLRRRLRNVVEEMAIASGVPVPEIYVLEAESGINAFAAGFTPGDAAVAVTRGTLELLDRDELQGVIAHEFSHILNGDMRLNIRMMGVLFGIMVLGLIGRMVMRGSYHGGLISRRQNRNAPAVMMIGLGLTILGWVGVFFARIIKAAVSRQREFLADASAVQFTRQTDGIANALKKIGGYEQHSYIRVADPEEVSHMLFAGGMANIAALFSTHPPLGVRIRALDPSFRDTDYPQVRHEQIVDAHISAQAAGLAAGAPATSQASRVAAAADNAVGDTFGQSIRDSIGRPTPQHVAFAKQLRSSIPEILYAAAHSPNGAYLLTLALILDTRHADRQLGIIEGQLGAARASLVRQYFTALQEIGAAYRLPLMEIAFPELKQRPAAKLEFLLDLVRRLIEVDGKIDLHEFCYYRIMARHLEQAIAPASDPRQNRVSKSRAQEAAIELLRIVADYGADNPADARHAFAAGMQEFGDWATRVPQDRDSRTTVERLDEALDILCKINSAGRQSMIRALSKTIAHDGRLTVTEAELLRAICATLDCPLPPILSATG